MDNTSIINNKNYNFTSTKPTLIKHSQTHKNSNQLIPKKKNTLYDIKHDSSYEFPLFFFGCNENLNSQIKDLDTYNDTLTLHK